MFTESQGRLLEDVGQLGLRGWWSPNRQRDVCGDFHTSEGTEREGLEWTVQSREANLAGIEEILGGEQWDQLGAFISESAQCN